MKTRLSFRRINLSLFQWWLIALGLVMAAGFSGHGLMHAPATGELVAELIATGSRPADLAPFDLARFAEGEPVREHNVI